MAHSLRRGAGGLSGWHHLTPQCPEAGEQKTWVLIPPLPLACPQKLKSGSGSFSHLGMGTVTASAAGVRWNHVSEGLCKLQVTRPCDVASCRFLLQFYFHESCVCSELLAHVQMDGWMDGQTRHRKCKHADCWPLQLLYPYKIPVVASLFTA